MDMPKAIAAIVPAMIAAPAFASVNVSLNLQIMQIISIISY